MPTVIRRNERSWAIELISKINAFISDKDLTIKKAGGESTISIKRGNSMFPDVLLYGNREQSIILQGWELKMPDVPIEDETFIKDAQRKAIALSLNSCLIWNFTYAVLYTRNGNDGNFTKVKQWSDTSFIRTRQDVETYRDKWEALLEQVIIEVNQYFVSGAFRQANIGDAISNATITTIIDRNKQLIADEIKRQAFGNTVISAFVDNWWTDICAEYEHDEPDRYCAYAKSIILSWANRILFAHLIKTRQNSAMSVDEIGEETTPREANVIFKRMTEKCDFYNIFGELPYNEIIPDLAWEDFVEFSLFLKNNGIDKLDQRALQNILESTVNSTKRAINGQFTTPEELAKILVRLTVLDWNDSFLDCCCGTGTIPKAAIQNKRKQLSIKDAVESVWACDKNNYPLQVANISLTDSDSINIANRLFQHNALSLTVGERIPIVDPATGETLQLKLPEFGAVASNLPFVEFERIPGDDKDLFPSVYGAGELDGRSDLYCYITLKIADLLKAGGRLGIIVSNSWLGTIAGQKFLRAITLVYDLLQVHISGKGRWFHNADIVTTIIILQKKTERSNDKIGFYLWKKSLSEFGVDVKNEDKLINSSLLEKELDPKVVEVAEYSATDVASIVGCGISYNALFHKVEWVLDLFPKLVKIKDIYTVFRGSRRGWDALFFPRSGEHQIEKPFLEKVLLNARGVTTLTAKADQDAFCCSMSVEELKNKGYVGALSWIEKFKDQRNGVGKPLPDVLKRSNMFWYEMRASELAEVFTMMNPDQRLFFAKFDAPSFVNQRLIGMTHKQEHSDTEFNHALLNSIITLFYIEASGFGRGLGVLDINKDNIANCFMPNPDSFTKESRDRIIDRFRRIKNRGIMNIKDELQDEDRILFEKEVLRGLGAEEYFDRIKNSLLSMQQTRGTARENA